MVEWRLHEVMGKKRLKILDVAKAAGLCWEAVANIYHGRSKQVALDTLDRLCKTLGCQVGDLLVYVPDGDGPPPA